MNVQNAFPTIFELRSSHSQLLAQQRQGTAPAELVPQVSSFVVRAKQTGAFLDVEEQRVAAQGLIDYWLTRLDRAAVPFDDATLVDFDESLAPELPDDRCPYVGLEAFREKDRTNFFGRAETVDKALSMLAQHRFLAAIGPSGSGKSSIILSGVLPALKDAHPDWRFAPVFCPGSEPVKNLEAAVAAANALTTEATSDAPLVVVVDQFEELFTLTEDVKARGAFVEKIVSVVQENGVVVVTMREDSVPRLAAHPELQKLFKEGDLRATPMSAAELREAIEKPAERINLKFESGLVDTLVNDVVGEPAALPLLQFTLYRLWTKRRRNRITRQAYADVGGGRSALERAAEEVYEDLKIVENRDTMRRILLRMVRPGIDAETTRSRVKVTDLLRIGDDPARVQTVLDKLVASRLVRRSEGETAQDAQVEVAHESLIRNWPRFVGWLDEKRSGLKELHRFEVLADEWAHFDRNSGFLDEGQLGDARRWLESDEAKEIGVKQSLRELVEESAQRIAAQKRREQLAKGLVTLLTLFIIAGLALALVVQRMRGKERLEQQAKIVEAERLADEARRNADIARERAAADARLAAAEAARNAEKKYSTELQAALDKATKTAEELRRKVDELSATRKELAEEKQESAEAEKAVQQVLQGYAPPVTSPVPVVESFRTLATAESLGLRKAARPIRAGVSLNGGSACCLVRDKSGERYLLTVGFAAGEQEGALVYQPGQADGGNDPIGTVARLGKRRYMSGGLVRLDKGMEVDSSIPQFGPIRGVATNKLRPGDQLRCVGRGSGLTVGKVVAIRENDIVTTIESEGGDAGGPVVNSRNELVGLLYAGQKDVSFVLPIGPILDELGVTLVPTRN